MEYCNDGDLEAYIKKHDLAEKDAIALFRQIINGFKYLHKKDVLHRDVKPSNFLLDNMKIKISDFGFARVILSEAWAESHYGTYPYMAPQILQGKPYNNMSDIWSLGVTLFFMLFKRIPWVSDNPFHLEREIKEKLKNNRLFETVLEKKRISKHAEDLLIRMIVYDENLRISWDRLFEHPLLQEQAIFGVETTLKASIIENKGISKTKSEFLKKKKVNVFTEKVDCLRFYCGTDPMTPEDACEKKKEVNFNNSNLNHYSMIHNDGDPFLKDDNPQDTLNIVNRKKGKSTNSALTKEQIEQMEKGKQESIEDLKNFHSQFSFLKKKSSPFNGETNLKTHPNLEFPSINHESENNSKNVSISQHNQSNSEVFFQHFVNMNEIK
jgi:serine/threonine protein kinase